MTTKPKIQVTKPGTPDTRFDDALAFATEKEVEAPKKSSRPATKEIRQSYDCPQDLKVCHRPDGLEDQRPFCRYSPLVCHRPDGLEDQLLFECAKPPVCHRPDGLEGRPHEGNEEVKVCHRPDGLEETSSHS